MEWSIEHNAFHLSTEAWESLVSHNAPGLFFLSILAIALSYPLLHTVLLGLSDIYSEQLSPDQRVVVLHHAIEALTLSLLFIPFTQTLISVFFEEKSIEDMADPFVVLGVFMAIIMTMYMFEIGTRFANLRPMVVAHHLCAYFDGILTAFFLGTANIKAAFLLVYFITYEAIIFVGLVMYRLAPTHRLTCPTILTGMAIFGVSRPFQLVWVVGSFMATGVGQLVLWQVVLQLTLTLCFTALQLYTLTIHYKLYRKARRRRNEVIKTLEEVSGDETSSEQQCGSEMSESSANSDHETA